MAGSAAPSATTLVYRRLISSSDRPFRLMLSRKLLHRISATCPSWSFCRA